MKRKANVPAEASKSTLGRNVNVFEVQGRRKRGEVTVAASSSFGRLNATKQLAWQEAADAEAKKLREGVCLALSLSTVIELGPRSFILVTEGT